MVLVIVALLVGCGDIVIDKTKFLEILIIEPSQNGNMGVLLIDGQLFSLTMARDYTDKGYAIPEGLYPYKRVESPTFGGTFEIIVEGHNYLIIHLFNVENESEGCISLGERPGWINGKRAVLKSGDTIKRFMKEMEGIDGGSIRIRRVY